MLDSLLSPRSVAIVGASRSPGKVGHEIVANLIGDGFGGEIIPVNPAADEILGLKCHPELRSCGRTIDLAVIAVPAAQVKATVEDALACGAKAIVVVSSGFGETGEEGAALEAEIAKAAKSGGARLLGPNCLGLINTRHRMNASFAGRAPREGAITVISQSGALCSAILDWARMSHLGLAKLVSIGNKADLTEMDFFTALAEDDQTKVIVGYLENISSGAAFVKAAEAAAMIKPIVILKGGSTASGMRAASSHTGALAGADIAYGAAFTRSGVIRADTFESLFDFAMALAMQPLPKGGRVAVITNAGGPGIMAADAIEKLGLTTATLASNTATALRARLPSSASLANPIDVLGDADPARYATALNAAQSDESVDSIIVILTPQAMTRPAETARAIIENVRGEKPTLAVFMGGSEVMPSRAELTEANLPAYTSPERAVAALAAMTRYSAWRGRPQRIVTRFPVNRRRVDRIIVRGLRAGLTHIGEVRAKEILRAYGFATPEGRMASGAEEAVEAAGRIGYPVAVKIVSRNIIHKSDIGGVRLNLSDAQAVRDAFDLMEYRIGAGRPDIGMEGVYVEKMAGPGREVIIGMTRDPQFGPMLMFGLGGIFVEVMKDVTFHLAPITAEEAMRMLKSTRSYELLHGVRGGHGVDVNAIAEALQRISQLVTDFPMIMELDINPLIVGGEGVEPVVADARMTIG